MKSDRPLKLLVVGASWPPETFLGRLMRGLVEAGVEVTVAFGAHPDQDWFWSAGLRYFRTRHWGGPKLLRLLRIVTMTIRGSIAAPQRLRSVLRHAGRLPGVTERLRLLHRILPFLFKEWDVLYFPWNSGAVNYLPLFDFGRPVLLSCRGSQVNVVPHNPARSVRPELAVTFKRTSRVHCVSRAIEKEAGLLGLDVAKSRVVYPGVDPEFFQPDGERPDDKRAAGPIEIITVTRHVWVKGLPYAFEAFRALLDAGVSARFSVIGGGPEMQRTLYDIHDLGIAEHVDLLGRMSPVEVRNRLRNADVFVLSSLSEGFCNAAIEAMACGLPVVLSDCGGSREAIREGVEGFLVPPRDPDAMARALQKLAVDESLRLRMGRRGRERVLAEFTLARQVREFASLLEETRQCRIA